MSEKLKFTVLFSRTVNTGNYESEKYGLNVEFYRDKYSIEDAFVKVINHVKDAIDRNENDE